jgi:hypothetical protein
MLLVAVGVLVTAGRAMVPDVKGTAAEQVMREVCEALSQMVRGDQMTRESNLRNGRLNRLTICILLRLNLALLRIFNQAVEFVQAGNNIPLREDLLKVRAHACAQPVCELFVEVSQAIGYLFGGRGKT